MAAEASRAFAVTHRGVLAIAIPMTLAYLTTPLVGVVSLGVVGQLGEPALVGGVAIGALVFDVAFVTFNFLRSGTTGLTAQAVGAGDRREIVAIFWRALVLALFLGILLFALEGPILAVALHLIGGSNAVQAATRTYLAIRVLSAPVALANYVILGWLIGLGRAGYGLLLQLILNGINIAASVAQRRTIAFRFERPTCAAVPSRMLANTALKTTFAAESEGAEKPFNDIQSVIESASKPKTMSASQISNRVQ